MEINKQADNDWLRLSATNEHGIRSISILYINIIIYQYSYHGEDRGALVVINIILFILMYVLVQVARKMLVYSQLFKI